MVLAKDVLKRPVEDLLDHLELVLLVRLEKVKVDAPMVEFDLQGLQVVQLLLVQLARISQEV